MNRTYLALGDSYTIGEQVPLYDSFPYQLVQLLREKGLMFFAPEILAKTGWTTDELMTAIDAYRFLPRYDLVTLLIGVNNQYRGRPADEFDREFRLLLEKSVDFADGKIENVFVLSIPDWGITPYAEGRDEMKIAQEIDLLNSICEKRSAERGVRFMDNAASLREDGRKQEFLVADGLHPSGLEYAKWARGLSEQIK